MLVSEAVQQVSWVYDRGDTDPGFGGRDRLPPQTIGILVCIVSILTRQGGSQNRIQP